MLLGLVVVVVVVEAAAAAAVALVLVELAVGLVMGMVVECVCGFEGLRVKCRADLPPRAVSGHKPFANPAPPRPSADKTPPQA